MSAEAIDADQPVVQRPRVGAFDSQGFAYSLPQAQFPSQSHIQFGAAPLLDPQDFLHLQREVAGSLHAIQTQSTAIQKSSDRLDDVSVKIEGLGTRVTALEEVLNESQKPILFDMTCQSLESCLLPDPKPSSVAARNSSSICMETMSLTEWNVPLPDLHPPRFITCIMCIKVSCQCLSTSMIGPTCDAKMGKKFCSHLIYWVKIHGIPVYAFK